MGIRTASFQSGRSRSPFSTCSWDRAAWVLTTLSSPPRAGLGCLWLYLIKQPVSGDSDNAFPLTQAQPLHQLTGMVLSF